jgi:hypothetical protein
MQCPTCGPSPKVVIADGVSLATQHTEWNVVGGWYKNITTDSNRPWLVLNAAFHSSPSLTLTLLYPLEFGELHCSLKLDHLGDQRKRISIVMVMLFSFQ